jgi:effector-binding domain-containing protein
MHDIHDQSRLASKRLVKWLSDNGYKVVSPERMTKAYRGE